MDFSIDAATEERLGHLRELGRSQVRPLGLEADRLGRPVPSDHPFFETLLRLGLGRTRWTGDPKARGRGPGNARGNLCVVEEFSYWDRGVAASLPGPGLEMRAAVDEVLEALRAGDVGQHEQREMLAILDSMRAEL